MKSNGWTKREGDRRSFIGGSDGPNHHGRRRIRPPPPVAGKARRGRTRGPVGKPDRPARHRDRAPQPSLVRTQHGQIVIEVQRHLFHPVKRWMAATLDGMVEGTGAVFEAKFMLPWSFSEVVAAEKHMAQLQHNMWVTASRTAVLSIITGGGKWVEMSHSGRSALPAPFAHGREEILALRRNR